jgi:hypothetical protein
MLSNKDLFGIKWSWLLITILDEGKLSGVGKLTQNDTTFLCIHAPGY